MEAILTDNGHEFCGTGRHPYELYLSPDDIAHRHTKVRHPFTHSFIERFNRAMPDEFFGIAFRTTFYEGMEALQTDFDAWLVQYDTERPHQGYRNLGRHLIETIQQYLPDC